MKTLILYCYFENDQTKKNLTHFLKKGIVENCNYFIIVNGGKCTVPFPPSVKALLRKENSTDLAAYKWFIEKMGDGYFLQYSSIYFINSSCVGPFVAPYFQQTWVDLFNHMLKDHDMVGPIVEIPPDNLGLQTLGLISRHNVPFIHTYMFGVNAKGFKIIKEVLKTMNMDKFHAIYNTERKLTSSILMEGGKIKSCLARFQKVNLNLKENWVSSKWNDTNVTCYEIPNNYFNMDIHPFEVVFVKNIRNANETRKVEHSGISKTLKVNLQNYTEWL